jgi:hypothetical protein
MSDVVNVLITPSMTFEELFGNQQFFLTANTLHRVCAEINVQYLSMHESTLMFIGGCD